VATAQPPRATRVSYTPEQKGFIEDLTNGFMDDIDRRRFQGIDVGAQALTKEMRTVRPLIRDFADEVSQLGYDLNDEERRIPTLRNLLTDAYKVIALAASLDRTVQRVNDHRLLDAEFRDLDASWRELSYRLTNTRGLSRIVTDRIAALNGLHEQIDQAIGVRPQVNRRELMLKINDLATDLRNLIDDVRLELGTRDTQRVLVGLNRARQQVVSIAALLDDNTISSDMITDEYKQFRVLWYPERARLQEFDNRFFERSLRRISQTDGEIHQLLLLPTKVDSTQLVYLTSALRKDIDEFFDRTSLRLLITLPRYDRVAGVASEFYGVCEHFIDEVNSNVEYEQLVESFRYIEDAQRNFLSVFQGINSREALAALNKIEQTIEALRSSLQVQSDQFDRRRAADLAALVETTADQLEMAAQRWLSRDRQSFATACLQSIRQMRTQTAQLHQSVIGGATTSQLRVQSEQLYDTWRTVYNYLIKCQTDDRPTLGRLSSRITPALVELRTMITQ
jgi:predicted  nucleic acid-binding Zn-ribbon protein